MNKHQRHKVHEFMDTLQEIIVCPYCLEENQLDPPLGCCGEVHATEAWIMPDDEIVLDDDIYEASFKYLSEQEKDAKEYAEECKFDQMRDDRLMEKEKENGN